MTIKQYLLGSIIVIALLFGATFFTSARISFGASTQVPGVTLHFIIPTPETQDYYTFFTATTTTATSTTAAGSNDPGFMKIAGAKDVDFYFSRGDTKGTGNSGSTQFKIQVTPDGVNWFDYNELGQVTFSVTDNQFYTRSGTTTISAATSTQLWAMEDIAYYGVRCIAIRATDGEASCSATANY